MTKHLHDPYGTICSDCGATLNTEYEIERRHCDKRYCDGPPSTWRTRFWSTEPYPRWYRLMMPIAIFLPWRNLGCFGIKVFFVYIDIYKAWTFPHFGIYINIGGWRLRPIAMLRNPRRARETMVDGWCHLWCWLQDHTGTGRVNDLVIRVAEKVTPADW